MGYKEPCLAYFTQSSYGSGMNLHAVVQKLNTPGHFEYYINGQSSIKTAAPLKSDALVWLSERNSMHIEKLHLRWYYFLNLMKSDDSYDNYLTAQDALLNKTINQYKPQYERG